MNCCWPIQFVIIRCVFTGEVKEVLAFTLAMMAAADMEVLSYWPAQGCVHP